MTYKVQIGYKVWKSMDSYTFNEIISGTIEHDPYNDCAFFICGDECLTSETIERIFQKANDTLHGLMDALIIRIGEAERRQRSVAIPYNRLLYGYCDSAGTVRHPSHRQLGL